MSTSRLDTSGVFQPVKIESSKTKLALLPDAVRFRSNGMEFRAAKPIVPWTEMTVNLRSPGDSKQVNCTGVIVDCKGNSHTGYVVSMVFMKVSRQSQERLAYLALSQMI